jgi:hypothetical protein
MVPVAWIVPPGGLLIEPSTLRKGGSKNEESSEVDQFECRRCGLPDSRCFWPLAGCSHTARGGVARRGSRVAGDDIDHSAETLNGMLDELESLVDGVRRISDNIAHDLRTPLARLRNRLESGDPAAFQGL